MKEERIWKPSSTAQSKALASSCYELFYGGSAGGGKSEFLVIDAIKQIKHPKYRAIMLRNTFPELERTLIAKSHEYYPSLGGKYNTQSHRWTFPSGAVIEFGYSENNVDIQKYRSAEYAWIGIDESTTFSDYQINYIVSRNRVADKSLKKRLRLASNPLGKSHAWHKKRFIDGKEPYKKYIDERTGLDYCFVPARAMDNRVLMENDPGYIASLDRLPEKERKALKDGNWDIFEGQFFSEWDSAYHVCEPYPISTMYPRFITIDYGYAQPSAVYWFAVDNNGRLIVYKELWGTGYRYSELKKNIIQMCDENELKMIDYIVIDPSSYSTKSGEKTLSEILVDNKQKYEDDTKDHGFYVMPGTNKRSTGWGYFREALAIKEYTHGIKTGGIVFFNTCYNAIRTIPLMQHDLRKPEDADSLLKDENGLNIDDPSDSIRYGIMSRYQKPSEARVEQSEFAKRFYDNQRKLGKKTLIVN